MSFDKNGFPDQAAHALYHWWEEELTGDERTSLLDGYIWSGTDQERLDKLKEMHIIFSKSKRTE